MSLTPPTLSQPFSLGGMSDIISDVESFIKENGIEEDTKQLLNHKISLSPTPSVSDSEDEKFDIVAPAPFYSEIENNEQIHNGIQEHDDIDSKDVPMDCSGTAQLPPPVLTEGPPELPPDNLATENYSGPFNFDISIADCNNKSSFTYSQMLKKLFIPMQTKFSVLFSIERRPVNRDLYIRATPVFSQSQHFQDLVVRCISHEQPTIECNKNLSSDVIQHVMRCENAQVRYHGNKHRKVRLSVVVPLAEPQPGVDVVREFFSFVCKSSCSPGMDRRPIDVVFTLEDVNGEILGRRSVAVRICMCPKRDMQKEEQDAVSSAPKRKIRKLNKSTTTPQSGRTTNDTTIYKLNVNIVGKENFREALISCRRLMADEILRNRTTEGADVPFQKCYDEIQEILGSQMQ